MRLTLKEINKHYVPKVFDYDNTVAINQKLGQLEDIEDELDIDLITLFKALKNGFCYEIEYEDEFEKGFFKLNNTSMQIDFDKKAFVIEAQIFIYFKDYGKTWALTKEELL